MAQDTPEGHASSDTEQILRELLKDIGIGKLNVHLVELPGVPTDVSSHNALKYAVEAHRYFARRLATGETSSMASYANVRDGWLEIYDRLVLAEARKDLEDWGSHPDNQAERNGFTAPEPEGTLYYDDQTLVKVRRALNKIGFSSLTAADAISAMQNEGIIFREHRSRDGDLRRLDNGQLQEWGDGEWHDVEEPPARGTAPVSTVHIEAPEAGVLNVVHED